MEKVSFFWIKTSFAAHLKFKSLEYQHFYYVPGASRMQDLSATHFQHNFG
jgi:hypothetical protein